MYIWDEDIEAILFIDGSARIFIYIYARTVTVVAVSFASRATITWHLRRALSTND